MQKLYDFSYFIFIVCYKSYKEMKSNDTLEIPIKKLVSLRFAEKLFSMHNGFVEVEIEIHI